MTVATSFKTSIYAYLDSLPTQTFQRLFSNPATCLVILRLLSTLAKQVIMGLLYIDKPIRRQDLQPWCRKEHIKEMESSLQELKKLHIFTEEQQWLVMNPVFRTQLRHALTGGGTHHSFGVPCTSKDRHHVDVGFLDRYATHKWEAILHFMVGTQSSDDLGLSVVSLLRGSGLMDEDKRDRARLKITNKGFQFLLQDTSTQVWMFLLQYLAMAENLQMDLVEALHFLFQLGSLELGAAYATDTLTPTQLQMLEDLRDYGIVYQRKKRSRRFYPTRLATTLTTGLNSLTSTLGSAVEVEPTDQQGFIILETNYRLYAYTDSPLQIAILNLFVTLKTRFANMVAGTITRDSILNALSHGITAEQIITYLTTHAHLHMRERTPVLPVTVTDQVRLWEMEKDRIRATDSCLYCNFPRAQEFTALLKYAQELGVVLWSNESKRMFAVTLEGHQAVKAFAKRKFTRSNGNENGHTGNSSTGV